MCQLQRAGGTTLKDCTSAAMQLLMTNNAAFCLNLDGRKGVNSLLHKKGFKKMPLYAVVEGGCSLTVHAIDDLITFYLPANWSA
jgi:hypothetical protein